MGRLPETFAGRRIAFRVPFTMPGTMVIGSSAGPVQFPTATFMQTEDKPFEIHRVIPRLSNVNTAIPESTLMRMVSIRMEDLGKEQFLTKQPLAGQPQDIQIINIVKGDVEKTWEWPDPYYLRKNENIIVSLQSIPYPTEVEGVGIQVEIVLEGFLIVIAPPSDRR